SVASKRNGGVGGAQRRVQEEALPEGASLLDRVDTTVLAVRVDDAVCVHRGGIDAPFEAARMVVDAAPAAPGIAAAAQGVRVRESPLRREVRAELGDVERSLALRGAERGDGTIRPYAIAVVLEDDRVGPAVAVDGRGEVPPEVVGGQELAPGP